jgi:hypothetical protein
MARLARQLELIDDDGQLGRNATRLLSAWGEDEGLAGILDDGGATVGAKWISEAVSRTVECIGGERWPGSNYAIWDQLALNVRPDRIGRREKRFLLETLRSTPMRGRMVELLKQSIDLFRGVWTGRDSRGKAERTILLRGIKPALTDDPLDRVIDATILAADAYEQTAGLLQQTFDSLIFAIRERGGRARQQDVLQDQRIRRHLDKTRIGLQAIIPAIDRATERLDQQPSASKVQIVDPLRQVRTDACEAAASVEQLVDTVMRRHLRVQKIKRKASWIEAGSYWTLMPGEHRVDGDSLPIWQNAFLHPFKIPNAYSLLGDLGHVAPDARYAEVS